MKSIKTNEPCRFIEEIQERQKKMAKSKRMVSSQKKSDSGNGDEKRKTRATSNDNGVGKTSEGGGNAAATALQQKEKKKGKATTYNNKKSGLPVVKATINRQYSVEHEAEMQKGGNEKEKQVVKRAEAVEESGGEKVDNDDEAGQINEMKRKIEEWESRQKR